MKKWVMGFLFVFYSTPLLAADDSFQFEVLAVKGAAFVVSAQSEEKPLAEGDTVSAGDSVQVREGGALSLSQDGEWKNVAHFEENSEAKINSVLPAKMTLVKGGIYAKLESLPKDSSFDIQTPTAIASVRGTEYRVTFAGGETEVFNFSDSTVYVYSADIDGSPSETALELSNSKKIEISKPGDELLPPNLMSYEDSKAGSALQMAILEKVEAAVVSGRVAKIQKISEMETKTQRANDYEYEEESRVTDTRRRPFKKT